MRRTKFFFKFGPRPHQIINGRPLIKADRTCVKQLTLKNVISFSVALLKYFTWTTLLTAFREWSFIYGWGWWKSENSTHSKFTPLRQPHTMFLPFKCLCTESFPPSKCLHWNLTTSPHFACTEIYAPHPYNNDHSLRNILISVGGDKSLQQRCMMTCYTGLRFYTSMQNPPSFAKYHKSKRFW